MHRVLVALFLTACSSSPVVVAEAGPVDTAADAGPACALDEGASRCPAVFPATDNVPSGCRATPLTLTSCDDGVTPVSALDKDTCQAEVTVLLSWASWCGYCHGVAGAIQKSIVERYAGKVRVVAAISADQNGDKPTIADCKSFKERYQLDKVALTLDPERVVTKQYIREHVIIDRKGRVRATFYRNLANAADFDRYIGDNVARMTAAIDDVLAHPDP